MKKLNLIRYFTMTMTLFLVIVSQTWAHRGVHVKDAWVRAAGTGQTVTGVFMKMAPHINGRLIAVQVAPTLASKAELHEMQMQNNVMKMREIPQLPLTIGQVLELKPGGYHIMLIDLKRPLNVGETIELQLQLEEQGHKTPFTQTIKAKVQNKAPASEKEHDHHH